MYTTGGGAGPFYGPGFPIGEMYYVTCDESGKASIKWQIQFQTGGPGNLRGTPQQIGATTYYPSNSPSDIIHLFQ